MQILLFVHPLSVALFHLEMYEIPNTQKYHTNSALMDWLLSVFYVVFFVNDILTVKSAEFKNFFNYFWLCACIKQNIDTVSLIKDIEFLFYVMVTPNSLFIFINRSCINQIIMIFRCTSFTRNFRIFRTCWIRNLLCCLFCRRLYFTLW